MPMVRQRITRTTAALLAALLVLALCGCGRHSPTAPDAFSITGVVTLRGYLTANDGRFAGTRIVDDASGVRVELLDRAGVAASTLTAAGRYHFDRVPKGAYRIRTRLANELSDISTEVTVIDRDFTVGEVLSLESIGDLYPAPNPFPGTMLAYFPVARDMIADLRIYDLGGNVVKLLYHGPLSQGQRQAFWDGRTDAGAAAPAGAYWLALRDEDGLRVQLVFRQ